MARRFTAERSGAKELGRILMAHGEVYVAQSTPAHINHCYRAIMDANSFPGPAVVVVYTPCQPEHGIADDASIHQARLAVDSRAFPLFTYDPRRGGMLKERLSLAGNPSNHHDWATLPDRSTLDFIDFCRTEGRFAAHFSADDEPTPELLATRDDRLANWHTLQEVAALRQWFRSRNPSGGLVGDSELPGRPRHQRYEPLLR